MKRIVCTGGGTAGHVIPALPVIERLQAAGKQIFYLGSETGPERDLIQGQGVDFFSIPADKLRRYASWRTLVMPFNVLRGFAQSLKLLHELQPDLVFSKGGYVAVPVVAAAAVLRIPMVAHESDASPGLTTQLTRPLARRICITLPPEISGRPLRPKEVVTGLPLRRRFLAPEPSRAEAEFRLDARRPLLVAFGGSLGSTVINSYVRAMASQLIQTFQVVHVCGKDQVVPDLETDRYRQVESVGEAMPDLLARADVVVSRAGMTTLYEILTLKKSAVVIPLPLSASRGDQIENARLLNALGVISVLAQEQLSVEALYAAILDAYSKRTARAVAIEQLQIVEGTGRVVEVLEEVLATNIC